MITENQLREAYNSILTQVKDASNSWVSGKGYPIIRMILSSGLALNGEYTRNFIDNLVNSNIIEVKRNDKDYTYRWTGNFTIEEATEKMMSYIFVNQSFKKGSHVFIMYNNSIHEGKIVESDAQSVIVAVKTKDGLKSMTLNQSSLESLSASTSLSQILKKLEGNLKKY